MAVDITDYSNLDLVHVFIKIIQEKFLTSHPQFKYQNDETIRKYLNNYLNEYHEHLEKYKKAVERKDKKLPEDKIPELFKRAVLLLKLLNDQTTQSGAISIAKFYSIPNFNFTIKYVENDRKHLILNQFFLKNIFDENDLLFMLSSVKCDNKNTIAVGESKKLIFSEDSEELIADNMSPEEIEQACKDFPLNIDRPFTNPNNSFLGKLSRSKSFENIEELNQTMEQQNPYQFSGNKYDDKNTVTKLSKQSKEHTNLFNRSMDSNEFKKAMYSDIKLKPKRDSKIINFENTLTDNLTPIPIKSNDYRFDDKSGTNFGEQQFILLASKHTTEQNEKKLSVIKEDEEFSLKN